MDSTIRKHYYDMCGACRGIEGENGKWHICEDETVSLVVAFGGSVLDYASDEEKMSTWHSFLNEVQHKDVFKKVVIQWMKRFTGVKEKIDEDRDLYCDYMKNHFPNGTQNPHQEYVEDRYPFVDVDYVETD